MVRGAAVILFALCAGCDGTPKTTTGERAEIADINSRNALQRIEELSSRVEELEGKLPSLKPNMTRR